MDFLWDRIKTENLSLVFLVKITTLQMWLSQIIANLCIPSPAPKPHQGNWEYFLFFFCLQQLLPHLPGAVSHYQEAKNLTSLLIGLFRKQITIIHSCTSSKSKQSLFRYQQVEISAEGCMFVVMIPADLSWFYFTLILNTYWHVGGFNLLNWSGACCKTPLIYI